MGRKKRSAAEGGGGTSYDAGGPAVGIPPAAGGAPPPPYYDSLGGGGSSHHRRPDDPAAAKKPKADTGETFLVKKYRAEKLYPAMEAFVRYTKTHRMLDASYVRWFRGATDEKPFVFSTRVGGQDLGWGRGRTREAAMDGACRAAFALFNAHGYKNFPLDDDCLTDLPPDVAPPPPPPPPPPPLPPLPPGGMVPGFYPPGTSAGPLPPPFPPHASAPYNNPAASSHNPHLPPFPPPPLPPGGLPPLPPGGLPPLPPGPPPLPGMMAPAASGAASSVVPDFVIPQPQVQAHAPVASSVMTTAAARRDDFAAAAAASLPGAPSAAAAAAAPPAQQPPPPSSAALQLKGGLKLVYDPGAEGPGEESMEERRARVLPRYRGGGRG